MKQAQAEAEYKKAIRLQSSGEYRAAEAIYRAILHHYPNLDAVRSNLGAALVSAGDLNAGLKQLEEALRQNPTNRDAMTNKAAALLAMGRPAEAIDLYKFLTMVEPESAIVHYNLASALGKQEDDKGALQAYLKTVRLDPSMAMAWNNLGLTYVRLGDSTKAEDAFRRCLALDPAHPSANVNLGNLHVNAGRIQEAFECYDVAIEAMPDFSIAWQRRADLLLASGQLDDALRDIDTALELDPDNVISLNMRGNILQALGQQYSARADYEAALKLEPGHVGIQENLARLKAEAIPAWHFTMLEDKARNAAYHAAIQRAVRPGHHVLDIGTGTGLLAMMAARVGADRVTACEASTVMSEVARKVIAANHLETKIQVYSIHSTQLEVGDHLPQPVDVVVSEIVDAALLGEGVLPSLRHAAAALAREGSIFIPALATVHIQFIQVPLDDFTNVEGFDLSAIAPMRFAATYKCMKLRRDVHTPLSAPVTIARFDFANLPPAVSDELPEVNQFTIEPSADGKVNAIALWFSLHMDDQEVVHSGPDGTLRHWGQAVHFLTNPLEVVQGRPVELEVSRTDSRWWFRLG